MSSPCLSGQERLTAVVKAASCCCKQWEIKTNVHYFFAARLGPRHCDSVEQQDRLKTPQIMSWVLSLDFQLVASVPSSSVQPGWLCYMVCVSYSVIKHATACPSSKPHVCVCVYVCICSWKHQTLLRHGNICTQCTLSELPLPGGNKSCYIFTFKTVTMS